MSEKFVNKDRVSELWNKTKEYVDTKVGNGEMSETFLVRAPIGTIVIWSGTVDNIPTSWQLCDGTNGTPDLRDKFVLGAGETYSVGETGGEEEVTLTKEQMPEHNHAFSILTSQTSIKVTHSTSGNYSTNANWYTDNNKYTRTNGSSEPHNNMPPYYALCYIMKITADATDGVTQDELTTALETKQDTLINGTGTTVEGNAVNINTPVYDIKTQAEFDALSEEQQNKGLYVISDNDSSGGGASAGEVYSTEEVRIGTWIDGKPLYAKTVQIDFSLSTSQTATGVPLPDGALPKFVDGFIGPTDWGAQYPIYFAEQNGNTLTYIFPVTVNDSVSIINRWVSSTPTTATVTVKYTKTTDEAVTT